MDNFRKILLFFSVAMLGVYHSCQAMDVPPANLTCREQQLIDAIKSNGPSTAILRIFFAKPYALFDGTENINYQDPFHGNTILMTAIIHNRLELVEKIIRDYVPKLSLKNNAGKTARELIDGKDSDKFSNLLTEYEQKILKKMNEFSDLSEVNEVESQQFIKYLEALPNPIETYPTYVERAIKKFHSPLLQALAIKFNFDPDTKIVEYLFSVLEGKSIVRSFNWTSGQSIFADPDPNSFERLITHYKKFINCKNAKGNTLLIEAVMEKNDDAVSLLLKNGAYPHETVTKQASDGTTISLPLICLAAQINGWETVCDLIQAGADINAQDENGDTSLMLILRARGDRSIALEDPYIRIFIENQTINLAIKNNADQSAIKVFLENCCKNHKMLEILNHLFVKQVMGTVEKRTHQQSLAIYTMCSDLCVSSKNMEPAKAIFKKIAELDCLDYTYTQNYINSINILLPILKDSQHIHHSFACKCAQAILNKIHFSTNDLERWKDLIYSDKNIGLLKAFYNQLDNKSVALHTCIASNFVQGIKFICEHSNSNVLESLNTEKQTPLAHATKLGHIDCVKELLNHGCNPGNQSTIDHAQEHCPAVKPLLAAAQTTTIYQLPHEILQKILAYVPTEFSIEKRIKEIDKIAALTCKYILNSIVDWNSKNLKLNTWLLSVKHLSDEEKRDCLNKSIQKGNFDQFCILLKHNPHLVIPIGDQESLLIMLAKRNSMPPFMTFETVITCIETLYKNSLISDTQRADLYQKSGYAYIESIDRSIYLKKGGKIIPSQLSLMDILLCRYAKEAPHIDAIHDTKIFKDTLSLLKQCGATLSKNILITFEKNIALTSCSWLTLLVKQNVKRLHVYNESILEFLINEPHIDINEEITSKNENTTKCCSMLAHIISEEWPSFIQIKILLAHTKTLINKIDSSNQTALDYLECDSDRKKELLHLLLANGAKTAAQLAIEKKDITLFNHCINNPRLKDRINGPLHIVPNVPSTPTVLKLCIDANFIDGIQALINANHNFNHVDANNEYPLIYALKHKNRDCALLLIDGGANVNCWDADGNSPLDWAIKHGYTDCVKLLLNHRCNPVSKEVSDYSTITTLLGTAQEKTLLHLPHEMINRIIAHVPSMPKFTERFNVVSTLAICCKYMQYGATTIFRNPNKDHDQPTSIWEQEISKSYLATMELTQKEQEALLWNAIEKKQYKELKVLLTTHPHLINSCYPNTQTNILAYLFATAARCPPTDIVTHIVETDKAINKTCTLLHKKTDLILTITDSLRLSFRFYDAKEEGLSAISMALYRIVSPYYSADERESWKWRLEYLIREGGYFNTETYYQPPKDAGHDSFALPNGDGFQLQPTLCILLYFCRDATATNAVRLFMSGAKPSLDINAKSMNGNKHTILHWATQIGLSHWAITTLLDHPKIDVNATTTDGLTALDLLDESQIDTYKKDTFRIRLEGKGAQKSKKPTASQPIKNNAAAQPSILPSAISSDQKALAVSPVLIPDKKPTIIQHHWYRSPYTYWTAALAACAALGYGVYTYLYPSESDADEDSGNNDGEEQVTQQNIQTPVYAQ